MDSESWEKTKTWSAWSGDEEDLRRLLTVAQERAEIVRDEHIAYSTRYERNALLDAESASAEFEDAERPAYVTQRVIAKTRDLERAEEDARAAAPLGFRVSDIDGTVESTKGNVDDCLAILDSRTCRQVAIDLPAFSLSEDYSIQLRPDVGARLRVRSSSRDRGAAAFDGLRREVAKSVPSWAWATRDSAIALMMLPFAVALSISVGISLQRAFGGGLAVGIILVSTLVGLLGVSLIGPVQRTFFPRFELSRAGATLKSRRVRAAVGSSVAYVAAIVIPLLLTR